MTNHNQGGAPTPSRRGFAAMDPEKQREIARKGGRASGGRPENLQGVDRRAAGRKGGEAVVRKYGPQHMADIGRKGGRASGGFPRVDAERRLEEAATRDHDRAAVHPTGMTPGHPGTPGAVTPSSPRQAGDRASANASSGETGEAAASS